MNDIKYIFRDFRGVIIKINLKKNGHMADISKIYNIDRNELWKHIEKPFEKFRKGEGTENEFWKSLSQSIGVTTPKGIKKVFHTNPSTYSSPNKSIISLIYRLKKLGYKCILLSDVYPPVKKNTSKLGWYSHFDDLILSCDVGLSKFDDTSNNTTKIFDYALKKYNIKAKEVIFIDDIKRNCIVAEKLGIKTILAQKPRQTIKDLKILLNIY